MPTSKPAVRAVSPTRQRIGLVGLAAALSVAWLAVSQGPDMSLTSVEKWTYQLQGLGTALDELARSDSDMLVIDYARNTDDGMQPLTREQVARLQRKPGGGRRLVIAYFSVGEAEEYRPYWQKAWREQPPEWIIAENCRWPRNHLVEFWNEGWRKIVFEAPQSYLARIQDAGFDGVYLDRVDVYADIEDRFPEARARMIAFVADLAATARSRQPNFLIIAQNAEELLEHPDYVKTIDAVAKEDLLFGLSGTSKRNDDATIAESKRLLDLSKQQGRPVFAVEYLDRKSAIESATAELRKFGYTPVFPTRALDGADPVREPVANSRAPAPVAPPIGNAAEEYGTPEYAERYCQGVWRKTAPDAAPISGRTN